MQDGKQVLTTLSLLFLCSTITCILQTPHLLVQDDSAAIMYVRIYLHLIYLPKCKLQLVRSPIFTQKTLCKWVWMAESS